MKYFYFLIFLLYTWHFIAQPLPKNNFTPDSFLHEEELISNYSHSETPSTLDVIIKNRISELNYQTPINLEYNEHVKKYIHYFLNEKKEWLIQCMSVANFYFPIFESYLDKYQLPMELKYMAVIESGLNPFARSKSGAIGLWQFLYPTSQLLNLKVNSFIDERQDPYKSTDAACRYLEYLYNLFGDWQLAIAAYNGGPTVVKNAMVRSGNKTTFWEIRPYLSAETQNYVPAFIAMTYIMNFAKEHLLNLPSSGIYFHQVDTVMIDKPLYFSDVAGTLNIPIEVIRFYNPQYKKDYIPMPSKPVPFVLPSDKVTAFIQQSNSIFNTSFPTAQINDHTIKKKAIQYTVKKGDYLTKLAIEFRCSTEDIKKWNNLTGNELTTGTTLTIWTIDEDTSSILK